MRAIDVASYQPTDLTELIRQARAEHVIVRLPVNEEGPNYKAHSQAQIASVWANGKSLGGYGWAYGEDSPEADVTEMLAVATPPVLWIDVERSKYTPPSLDWLNRAGRELDTLHQRKGIYSSHEEWRALYGDGARLEGEWYLWYAGYDGKPDLSSFRPFGAWTQAHGHQFQGSPLDTSVFLAEVCS